MALEVKFINNIEQINQEEWNALSASPYPFTRYEFLSLLEQTGAVNGDNGWFAHYMCIFEDDTLVVGLPLYQKTSWFGEYVFDWAWDEAYTRYGLAYYPKLTCAIPFTPVPGPRILTQRALTPELISLITEHIETLCEEADYSSCHLLFPTLSISDELTKQGWQQRKNVQFHWFNQNYHTFDDFLATFTARKRKNVKKERERVKQANVTIHRLYGDQIEEKHLQFFYRCYQQTYAKRSGHIGYLSQAFFTGLLTHLRNNVMLVIASQEETPIAAALYFYDENCLYGRYWGSLKDIDSLHFECCYYQGIEFCIENGLRCFNPGTQGEHKIQRGFVPTECYSNHWLKDRRFHHAITRFIQEESSHIEHYKKQTYALLPFKEPN